MPAFRITLISKGLLLAILATAVAQEVERVKVRFVSFPKLEDPQPVELLLGDDKTLSVELPTNSISSTYQIPKPAKWVLGKTVVDADGKPSFTVYGSAPALAAAEQVVVVARKGKTDADGFTLIPFADNADGFGGGSCIFYNASKVDIACRLGDTKLVVKPLECKLATPKPSDVLNDKELLFVFLFFRKAQEAQPFYSSQWRYSKKARNMVFLYHDANSIHLKVHIIRDYLP